MIVDIKNMGDSSRNKCVVMAFTTFTGAVSHFMFCGVPDLVCTIDPAVGKKNRKNCQ